MAITGWGTALPDKVVTNDDLAATMDTSDEWITERTGIRERRVGGTTSELATEAGRVALARAGVEPSEIDLVILATTTPDQTVPGTSPTVEKNLGLRCGAIDINAACSGFVYGLAMANGIVGSGASKVLAHRRRDVSRASPTGTTAAPPSSSPTVPPPWWSRPSTALASSSPGTSTPTARPSRSSTPMSATTSRWTAGGLPPGRAPDGRLGDQGARCRRRSRPTTSR